MKRIAVHSYVVILMALCVKFKTQHLVYNPIFSHLKTCLNLHSQFYVVQEDDKIFSPSEHKTF